MSSSNCDFWRMRLLEAGFGSICLKAYIIRRDGKDGYKGWLELSNGMKNSVIGSWKKPTPDYHFLHEVCRMLGDETDPKDENWPRHHFALQIARIIKLTSLPTPKKLFQIAYNFGQLYAEHQKVPYSEAVMAHVEKFKSVDSLIVLNRSVSW